MKDNALISKNTLELINYDYRQFLKAEYERRNSNNPSYSMRAFANQLGLHVGTLSAVINGTRHLTPQKAKQVCEKLKLSQENTFVFLSSLNSKRHGLKELAQITYAPVEQLVSDRKGAEIIAEWEHYALLCLIETTDFRSDTSWISQRLGINEQRTKKIINNLISQEMLEYDQFKNLKYVHTKIGTPDDYVDIATRQAHKEKLDMAKEKLDEVPIELRGFFSETMAINMNKLQEAKELMREFKRRLAALLESGERQEVYHIAMQLFPLSERPEDQREQ